MMLRKKGDLQMCMFVCRHTYKHACKQVHTYVCIIIKYVCIIIKYVCIIIKYVCIIIKYVYPPACHGLVMMLREEGDTLVLCLCANTYTYTHTHTRMHVHRYAYIRIKYVCIAAKYVCIAAKYVCIAANMYAYIPPCYSLAIMLRKEGDLRVCMFVCTQIHGHMLHVYACMHAYTHTYMYIHICILLSNMYISSSLLLNFLLCCAKWVECRSVRVCVCMHTHRHTHTKKYKTHIYMYAYSTPLLFCCE